MFSSGFGEAKVAIPSGPVKTSQKKRWPPCTVSQVMCPHPCPLDKFLDPLLMLLTLNPFDTLATAKTTAKLYNIQGVVVCAIKMQIL